MTASNAPRRALKVLHLLNVLDIGGMEAGVLNIVNGIPRERVAGGICSFRPAEAFRPRVGPGVPLFEFQKRDGNDPRLVAQLCRLFRRERPDVVHTHSWGTLCEGVIAARLARVPHVVHGEHGTMEARGHNLRVQRFMWSRVDRVLSVSDRLADRMSKTVGFARGRIQVIRNGVDSGALAGGARDAARAALGIATDETLVLAVGRLVPVKDHATLLEAMAGVVRDSRVRCRLAIAGDGPLRPALEDQRRRLGLTETVMLLGARHDVPDLLAASDLFVLSSRSEGLSNTILEAMAAGRAVVATRVGGNDELVDDGRTGLLVDPADPRALSAAICDLAADRRTLAAMESAGRHAAVQRFSIENMLAAYEAMYRSVCGSATTASGARNEVVRV